MAPPRVEYSEVIGNRICNEIVTGRSLRSICKDKGMPPCSTVFKWLATTPAFVEQYARAKTVQAEAMAEEILDIADDDRNDEITKEAVQRSRLRVDSRKWLMSKLAPKKYGDKVDLTHSAPGGGPVKIEVEFVGHEKG